MSGLNDITIIGAGTMGHAIAMIFAMGGKNVFLTDIKEEALKQAKELIYTSLRTLEDLGECAEKPEEIMQRIIISNKYEICVEKSDMVVEAIIEDVEAKKKLFDELARCIKDTTIVASNTSYLNIFPLAPSSLQHQLLIAHYFSPPYIIPLVEIVPGPKTDKLLLLKADKWLKDVGMTTVIMNKFVPGFIVNRIQKAAQREVLYMIDEKIADPKEIDRAVKATLGIRLPILGLFAKLDFTGLDMVARALNVPSIGLANEERKRPVMDLVERGQLGVKSGKGFYDYTDRSLSEVLRERDVKLIQVLKLLRKLGEVE